MPHQHYFLAKHEEIAADQITLCGDEHHHLSRVRRLQVGDKIWVTDGQGMMFSGVISEITKRHTKVEIGEQLPNYGEEPFRLTLAQAMTKAARFEWLLEKGAEMGVAAFWPMMTQFSTVKSNKGNMERWQRILKTALKQCGRCVLPAVEKPLPFEKIIEKSSDFAYRWIAHRPAPEDSHLWRFSNEVEISHPANGLLLIGPEGGFSDEEIEMAAHSDFDFLDLGKRRLRSETAGIVAASLILNQFHLS
ncbi:MAG: RsmE family RNA methyltransferase [bacterium]